MKLPTLALLAAFLLTLPASAGTLRLTGNKSVTVEVTLADTVAAPGATVAVAMRLQPVEGIHINLTPPLDFKADSASALPLAGALAVPKGAAYLDTKSPVVQRFTVPKDAKPGKLTLKGTLVYFFCSDKEGWCSKYKQPVEIGLTVRR